MDEKYRHPKDVGAKRRRRLVRYKKMAALVSPYVRSAEEFAEIVARHRDFIASGGGGGRWQTFATAGPGVGVVFGVYLDQEQEEAGGAPSAIEGSAAAGTAPDERFAGPSSAAKGAQAQLQHARLSGLDLRGVELPYANLCGAYCQDQDLSGANLSGALITDADFSGSSFEGANLAGADFSRSNLICCNLRDADLTGTDFENADLTGADLRGARVEGAVFAQAYMERVQR